MKPAQIERGQIHAEIAIHAHIRESTRFCFRNTLQLVITRARLSPFYEVGKNEVAVLFAEVLLFTLQLVEPRKHRLHQGVFF